MLRLLLCGLCFALVACEAPATRAADQWPVSPVQLGMLASAKADPGASAYARTCVACHGVDGHGNAAKTGADFSASTGPLTKSDAELMASILDGKTGTVGSMPPHRALLTATEATAVLAYVRANFGKGIAPSSDAGAPAAP